MVEVNFAGKIIGDLRENKVFVTSRRPEHYMRKYRGFGISKNVLDILKRKGCEIVMIHYQDELGNYRRYHCPLSFYTDSKDKYADGDDLQHFVSMEKMSDYMDSLVDNYKLERGIERR